MSKQVIAILVLAVASASWAQQEVTRLQCDGKFSNYVQDVRDVVNQGGYVEIRKDAVKLVAILGFDGVYKILGEDAAQVFFELANDKLLLGNINRFSGELYVYRRRAKPVSGDYGGFEKIWNGACRPAKPLF